MAEFRCLLSIGLVVSIHVTARAQYCGDFDANGALDLLDVEAFLDCVAGPDAPPTGAGCWAFDADLDVDVDFADFAALQAAFGTTAADPERVMGIWLGSGQTPEGATHPLRLTLAQWGHRVWGLGELAVNPADPLNGTPAFRLAGVIEGDRMRLGMSPALTNLCWERSTDAYVATLEYDAVNSVLTLTDVIEYLPVGCGQVVGAFEVTRTDEPYQPGNADLPGTWEGHMVTPPGWFYSPIPFWHHRKSFQQAGPTIAGWMQVSPGGPWGTMSLTWDPSSMTVVYRWVCEIRFTYKGVVDGNKCSGVFKWTYVAPGEETPDALFDGVFVYTLQEEFVPPGPIIPGC